MAAKQYKQVRYGSIRYFFYLLQSKYWFFDVGISKGIELPVKKHTVIYFAHGIPYKKIGADINYNDKLNLYGDYQIGRLSTYVLTPCQFSTEIFAHAYKIDKDKFIQIGCPRTDCLFAKENYEFDDKRMKNLQNKKIILYLPTMREWNPEDMSYTDFINDLQLNENELLIYKSHPYNKLNISDRNVLDVSDVVSINDLYMIADVLITDYSSAMFDFALTGKPILLYQPDYEEYNLRRGLYIEKKDIPLQMFSERKSLNEALLQTLRDPAYRAERIHESEMMVEKYVCDDNEFTCDNLCKIIGIE